MKAFDKLVPNDSCRGAGNAAYARQMADMCFGVNETRLATKRLDGLFTVGRVQTPTLGLVVKRDEAIARHVTRKFYELFASGDSDAGELTFKYLPGKELLAGEKHLFERHTLEALKEKLDGRDLHFETTVSKKQEKEYTLHATLMDKKTGEPLKVADKGVTAELKFTPNSESGTVSINLGEFDATSLDGHTLVVFEELTKQSDIDGKTTDVTVAEHKDINDEGQSVTVTSTPAGSTYGKTGVDMTNIAIAIGILLIAAGCATAYGIKSRKGKHHVLLLIVL